MRFLPLFLVMTTFVGCSLVNKTALRTTANVIREGSDESFTEGNWAFFKEAMPGNIKLLEGLWFADQSNENLLGLLIKAHAAYAFVVHETQALEAIITDDYNSTAKEQAILHYEKAIFYAVKLLEENGISQEEFFSKEFSLKLPKVFEDKFDDSHLSGLFYFAQALGSSINLQRNNVVKMSYLSHVKSMLSWVCMRDRDIENGSCGLFQSVIEASTPTMLGGSQEKAKKQFLDVIAKQPYNLMARLSLIQYHLIPMLEEDEFDKEMALLKRDINSWYKGIKDSSQAEKKYSSHREFNLFNAMAKERFQVIKKIKKEIF